MKRTLLTLVLSSVAASALAGGPPLATFVTASLSKSPPSVFPKGDASQEPLPFRAVDTWGVSPGGRQVTVRWQCESLQHAGEGERQDVSLRLRSRGAAGPASARVLAVQSESDLENRRPAN
ncbi:MAG: hypothetical protein AAGJ46_16070 [Planctomycetota bacterium]